VIRSGLVLITLAVAAPAATAEPSWIGNTFDHQVVERFVRLQVGLRDLVHDALGHLFAFISIDDVASPIPDVSVLTTQPVPNVESSGFGWRDDPIRHTRKWHSGADLKGKHGTPVGAAGDGVVTFTGRYYGYGNMITIDHGGGVVTAYAHLQKILVKPGTVITAGDLIGEVGSTGRATGPHLHFEVRLEGRPVDPATALAVGDLERRWPAAGILASFALSPEIQADFASSVDPPKQPAPKHETEPKGPRPERAGRGPRVKPVS